MNKDVTERPVQSPVKAATVQKSCRNPSHAWSAGQPTGQEPDHPPSAGRVPWAPLPTEDGGGEDRGAGPKLSAPRPMCPCALGCPACTCLGCGRPGDKSLEEQRPWERLGGDAGGAGAARPPRPLCRTDDGQEGQSPTWSCWEGAGENWKRCPPLALLPRCSLPFSPPLSLYFLVAQFPPASKGLFLPTKIRPLLLNEDRRQFPKLTYRIKKPFWKWQKPKHNAPPVQARGRRQPSPSVSAPWSRGSGRPSATGSFGPVPTPGTAKAPREIPAASPGALRKDVGQWNTKYGEGSGRGPRTRLAGLSSRASQGPRAGVGGEDRLGPLGRHLSGEQGRGDPVNQGLPGVELGKSLGWTQPHGAQD